MKIAVLCLLLYIAQTIQVASQAKLEDDQLGDFHKSKLALFILSFASMSSRLERPLVDLDYAISDMYVDLKDALLEVEQDFFQRSAQHKKIIDELDLNMGNAQIEISNSHNLVDNSLTASLTQLNNKMNQLQDFVGQNKIAQGREESLQKDNSKLYSDKIQDHQTALKIIDGAFEIVQKFISGELDINQKDKVDQEVQELTGCLNKKYDNYPLVTALIESIPTFENMKQLKKIRQKLVRIKQAVQDQYNEDLFHDRSQTALYEKRRSQLEKELQIFQSQIADNLHSISLVQQKISAEEEFQDLRRIDVQMFSQLKQDENSAFAYEITIYQDLRNMYQTEFELGERALNFIKSNQFADLVKSNLDMNLRK